MTGRSVSWKKGVPAVFLAKRGVSVITAEGGPCSENGVKRMSIVLFKLKSKELSRVFSRILRLV